MVPVIIIRLFVAFTKSLFPGVATHSPKSDTFSDSWNRLFYVDLYELSDGGDVSITQYFLRRRNPNTGILT